MNENLEHTQIDIYDVKAYRCNEAGEKDALGGFIYLQASSSGFISFQISEDYGAFSAPEFLENGEAQIIGDGNIKADKMYHISFAVSNEYGTNYKVIPLYISTHRAELGYMGGGFGITPPVYDDGYYFNGVIKVPVYDGNKNIINWRIL